MTELFYSESLSQTADAILEKTYDRVIVIPACMERKNFPTLLESIRFASQVSNFLVLTILVVNERENAAIEVKQDNAGLIEDLKESLKFSEKEESTGHENLLYGELDRLSLLVVNRTGTNCFPSDQGVGLARKIGCDLAAYLVEVTNSVSFSFIYTSDADAILPEDYFLPPKELIHHPKKYSLMLHGFEHYSEKEAPISQVYAMQAYQAYLHYYADSLREAGSPYGIQTVGSCLAFRAESYLQVRGFPRRDAGEDFYLVNKLLKVGKKIDAVCDPIKLQGRVSYRVPFGTGASIGKISDGCDKGKDYQIYDPKCFGVLKRVLLAAENSLTSEEINIENFNPGITVDELRIVESMGIRQAIERAIKNAKRSELRLKAFHDWFDAFKTLKFIHRLRDELYPSQPVEAVLKL